MAENDGVLPFELWFLFGVRLTDLPGVGLACFIATLGFLLFCGLNSEEDIFYNEHVKFTQRNNLCFVKMDCEILTAFGLLVCLGVEISCNLGESKVNYVSKNLV